VRGPRALAQFSLAAAIAASLTLAGGCSLFCRRCPEPDKYFSRRFPVSALMRFVYSVEVRDWDDAYESLTPSSREKITRLQLQFGLPFLKEPQTGIPVLEIITESIRRWSVRSTEDADVTVVEVLYQGHGRGGVYVELHIPVYLLREGGEWRVDVVKTAEGLAADHRVRRTGASRAPPAAA
jgi:hypothetical protein